MFQDWVTILVKFWITCCEISRLGVAAQNENVSVITASPTTLPPLLTETFEIYLFNARLEDVEEYMRTQRNVHGYLARFENEFQRFVVKNQMTYCPYVPVCDFKINALTDQKSCCDSCICDGKCDSERGCCPTIINETKFIYDTNVTVLVNGINIMLSSVITKPKGLRMKTCNLRHLTIRPGYSQKGFMAVSDCTIQSDLLLVYNCTRPYTDDLRIRYTLPAYSNISLSIFRNEFCALCNGVLIENIMYFYPVVSCSNREHLITNIKSEKKLVELIFADKTCDLAYEVDDERIYVKECKYHISKCNVTATWDTYDVELDLACQLYESKFMHEKYVFRNVFCAMCNGISPHSVTCILNPILATNIFTFSGLLNLDFDQGFSTTYLEQNRDNQRSSCSANQLYDAITNRCKDIYCPQMRILRDGRCINMFINVRDAFSYILYVRMKPLSTITAVDVFANDSDWSSTVMSVFRENFTNLIICEAHILFKFDIDFDKITLPTLSLSKLQYVDVRIRLFGRTKDPWRVADELLRLHNTKLRIVSDVNTTFEYILFIIDREPRYFDIVKMFLEQNGFYSEIISSHTPRKRLEIVSKYALSDIDGLSLLPYTISSLFIHDCYMNSYEVNVIRFSSCPKVNISKADIPWTKHLDGLNLNALKIPSNKYYFIDYLHIMICIDMFQEIMHHLTPDRTLTAEVIVSITCSSLSILSLLLSLIVYCVFPKLTANMPGKNNMSLTVNLLVAQTLLLVGSLGPFEQYSTACKVVGILIHYIWLCGVFWMNVCTYHMFCVLAKTHAPVSDNGSKTFTFYLLYVCLMSSIFVLANIISSTLTSGNLGYGGKFCYIISKEKLLFTFVLPTLVVIVINISLFLIVILKIRKVPNLRKHVHNERNELIIFVKLSTITGLTWSFGFLYIWTKLQTFSYIFTILNASQGIFILFAFVLNRKLLTLFKERFKVSSRNEDKKPSDLSKRTSSSKL